ncbi:hypothetical protein ACH5RR_010688 [Cinchona calisaya]|uniref:CUE domain-containing protein n=1 Tax=Cinchona calisaya TaxID=153742 RepID=A0ABD3AJR7_9GENT
MGLKKVYKVLMEIFPEVDSRALRAVAIEHHKDADYAVEVVLTEVIPFLTEKSVHNSSSNDNGAILQLSKAAEVVANGTSSEHVLGENVRCPEEEQHGPFYDAKDEHDQTFDDSNDRPDEIYLDSRPQKVASVRKCDERSVTSAAATSSCVLSDLLINENGANADDGKLIGDHASEETPCGMLEESSIIVGYNQNSQLTLKPLEHDNLGSNQSLDNCLGADSSDRKNHEKNVSVKNSVVHHSPWNFEPITLTSTESMVQLVDVPDIQNSSLEKELSGVKNAAIKAESLSEMVDVEDEPILNSVVTRSSQICSIDLLEDTIADARNNKKTLLSAGETVISLIKEVELQEKAAEQAKQDAANGGLETHKRVEDLKQMLQHAKAANDMHAGEIYGEKAILATEVRELQSRLLCLSDERDKSLRILDEISQSLEMRLAVAEKERKMAEEEKLEKEDVAWKALKDQEAAMEKVVQEANILKQEAEENAKLREFLMNRGQVVDTLQGEISVICTDVRFLKEKFDERLPLSKSLTSSQTSCIVASSISSWKSMTSEQADQVTDNDPSVTLEKTDPIPLFNEPEFVGEHKVIDDHKELTDEGWEIFDNCDAYM